MMGVMMIDGDTDRFERAKNEAPQGGRPVFCFLPSVCACVAFLPVCTCRIARKASRVETNESGKCTFRYRLSCNMKFLTTGFSAVSSLSRTDSNVLCYNLASLKTQSITQLTKPRSAIMYISRRDMDREQASHVSLTFIHAFFTSV
jgi:hypothetical protein